MGKYLAIVTIATIALVLLVAITGCTGSGRQWSITLQGDHSVTLNRSVYDTLVNCNETIGDVNGVPLEVFLYYYGMYPVTAVTIDGKQYDWRQEAHDTDGSMPFLVLQDGRVYDGKTTRSVSQINVTTTDKPATSSLELPASIMYSLGHEGHEGLIHGNASQIIVYYVDALGYYRYEHARASGSIRNITALGEPIRAVCVYPSVSKVNSRALVTGLPSNLSRGDFASGVPDSPTIFDRLHSDGKPAVWIGGISSPVYLGDYVVYRPDTNHDGRDSDEIAAEAIRQYRSGTNLIVVHFKDTDTKAHAYGPESKEAADALRDADEKIGLIDSVLGPGTVVVVYADHGGHDLKTGGNHGTLIPEDMTVPLVIHTV